MTSRDIANQLAGSTYPTQFLRSIVEQAKQSGIVIVSGASDDLMEFHGAINDEVGAYGGTTVRVDKEGVVPDFESLDKDDKDALRDYFRRENSGQEIEAVWCGDGEDFTWTFRTKIPHEVFEILEPGEDHGKYCLGIIFSLADVA